MGESEAFRIDPRAGRIEALTSPEGFIAPSDLASPALVLGRGLPRRDPPVAAVGLLAVRGDGGRGDPE